MDFFGCGEYCRKRDFSGRRSSPWDEAANLPLERKPGWRRPTKGFELQSPRAHNWTQTSQKLPTPRGFAPMTTLGMVLTGCAVDAVNNDGTLSPEESPERNF